MTTIYTKVSKVTGTPYTKVSSGIVIYDASDYAYDAVIAYDGALNIYTNVAKPSSGGAIATAGLYYGFGAFTYSGGQVLRQDNWTKVTKAT